MLLPLWVEQPLLDGQASAVYFYCSVLFDDAGHQEGAQVSGGRARKVQSHCHEAVSSVVQYFCHVCVLHAQPARMCLCKFGNTLRVALLNCTALSA
jgi:hypothetical protein